jgi:hypothetical protein
MSVHKYFFKGNIGRMFPGIGYKQKSISFRDAF